MIKRVLPFFFIILLILPGVLAINIKVEKVSKEETIILDLNKPAILELKVTNLGTSGIFKFENSPGFFVLNSVETEIKQGETKNVLLKIYTREDFSYIKPYYTLQYYITSPDGSIEKEEVDVKVIDLRNVFEVSSDKINPDSEKINIYIKNKENYNFKKIKAEFSSKFFKFDESFSLEPKEKKTFTKSISKSDFNQLTAGVYTIITKIETENKNVETEGTIEFTEKTLVTSEKKDYGFFIVTNIISKSNEGNVIVDSNTTIGKNIVSRLFTSFSPEPDAIEREGFNIEYTWNKDINPGEKLDIIVKTNWLFPFLVVFFIVIAVVFAKNYSRTNLVLKKKVSFVNAKGGEFALKVSIMVNAKKHTERISIVDRLPPLVKLHERFAGEQPARIDEKNRRIEWEIGNLDRGEVRVISYIIYSKVGVLGKFSLPTATAVYESEGKVEEAVSNRAFFVAEQRRGETED